MYIKIFEGPPSNILKKLEKKTRKKSYFFYQIFIIFFGLFAQIWPFFCQFWHFLLNFGQTGIFLKIELGDWAFIYT